MLFIEQYDSVRTEFDGGGDDGDSVSSMSSYNYLVQINCIYKNGSFYYMANTDNCSSVQRN